MKPCTLALHEVGCVLRLRGEHRVKRTSKMRSSHLPQVRHAYLLLAKMSQTVFTCKFGGITTLRRCRPGSPSKTEGTPSLRCGLRAQSHALACAQRAPWQGATVGLAACSRAAVLRAPGCHERTQSPRFRLLHAHE